MLYPLMACPEIEPYEYQQEDSDKLANGEVFGLASDPGTGKTLTALLAAAKKGAHRILVTCPAVALPVWMREAKAFHYWNVMYLKDIVLGAPIPEGPLLVITGYEYFVGSIPAQTHIWRCPKFDLMICDEAHYLKNPHSQRTELVYGNTMLAQVSWAVWPLSGTFMLNHPGELWTHITVLDPERIGWADYFHYTRRYCRFDMKRVTKTKTIEKITGAEKAYAGELKSRLTGLFAKRAASINNLPPINFVMRPFELDASGQALFDQLEEDTEDNAKLRQALSSPDPIAALKALTGTHLARMRTAIAMAKAPGVIEYVKDLLDNTDEKILLWAWHMAPFEELVKGLSGKTKVVSIRGETTPKKREAAETDFQTDPRCRVFVGQIQAAGQAITLHAGTREIFLEQAYTPALNFQAALRAWRIGQTKSVLVETAYIPDTVDEAIQRLLNGKSADIAALEGVI